MKGNDVAHLFKQGRLDEAIAEAGETIRRAPADTGARILLAELLLFASDFERADAVLLATDSLDPGAALVVAEFRQLLRAASARHQLTTEGRVPEFLGLPTPTQAHALGALVALRAGDGPAAAAAMEAAEAARPPSSGTGNGKPFADFRDADDVYGGSLEVLTTTGKYYWVPVDRVESIDFHAPRRARDLFWRRCTMSVRNGPDGDVYLPALYEADGWVDDTLRLGRRTEWSDTAPVRGAGQRTFMAGDDAMPINEIRSLLFS